MNVERCQLATEPQTEPTDFSCECLLPGGVARICCDGAKLEIRSWGTHGGLHGLFQQPLDV